MIDEPGCIGGKLISYIPQRDPDSDLQRRGIHVVRRLRRIDVIARVAILIFPAAVAHDLERAVGNHLVGIRVRRHPGAALVHVELELIVKLAADDLVARAFDPREDRLVESSALDVGARRGELDHREGTDEIRIEAQRDARELEVLERARGADAVIRIGRY